MSPLGQAFTQSPQATHLRGSTWATPSTRVMAPWGHTFTQEPRPMQP